MFKKERKISIAISVEFSMKIVFHKKIVYSNKQFGYYINITVDNVFL